MGFFKDFKDDFSQAVNDLMPAEDNLENGVKDGDLAVNTLENEVDVESELSKLDGLLEHVTKQAAPMKKETVVPEVPVKKEIVQPEIPVVTPVVPRREQRIMPNIETKFTQEERRMPENVAPVAKETSVPVSDEVSTITEGTVIKGDIISNGSLDIRGSVEGNIGCNGKIVVTGTVTGNSNASEFFADAAKVEGEIVSSGTVKIGLGSVIIGNVSSASAVIAGAIKGDIDVQGPVVVDTSAVVMGNIKSRSVQINNGAVIEGFCSQCYSDVDVEGLFDNKEGTEA